ncbi:MAG: hypothetical protein K5905_15260 [Roseibium sp.]|uniref:hypothetical protein n=1 Tax=Roseibium sp. TaxID=1936156 RepID=UPI00262A1354|nr:hypothetical protein [Roseibium sp.]MCV0426818.1 hypothetical protein [Roseibium sp.]
MPYTKLGALIAGIVFILGCMQIAVAFAVSTGLMVEPSPGLFLGNSTTGDAIDSGILKILAAVAFGIITEISQSVAKQ